MTMSTKTHKKIKLNKPILHKNIQKPTGTFHQIRKTDKLSKDKVSRILMQVKKRLDDTGVMFLNDVNSDSRVDAKSLSALILFVTGLVVTELSDGKYTDTFKQAYRSSLVLSLTSAENQLSNLLDDTTFMIDDDLESFLQRQYNELSPIWDSSISSMSDSLISRIRLVITTGIRNGKTLGQIKSDIDDIKDKCARTLFLSSSDEVNDSSRRAKLASLLLIDDKIASINNIHGSNISSVLVWQSALSVVTREWHAAIHGKEVDRAFIDKFYSENNNWRNCYCVQTPIITIDGKIPDEIAKAFADQLKAFKRGERGLPTRMAQFRTRTSVK